jgi:hypothetical protein
MKDKKRNTGLILGIVAIVAILAAAAVLIVLITRPAQQTSLTQTSAPPASPSVSASGPASMQPQTTPEPSGTESGQEKLAESFIRTDIPALTEAEKLEQIDFDHRAFRPLYTPAISLIAEDGLDYGSQTAAPWTSVVQPDGGQFRTFTLSLGQSPAQAGKIIWQVSCVPFPGGPAAASDKPGGLLLSGEISTGATSFTVDFAKVYASDMTLHSPPPVLSGVGLNVNLIKPDILLPKISIDALSALKQQQPVPLRTYYVRAFPADASGNSIGDGGAGLPVLYGDQLPAIKSSLLPSSAISLTFSLEPARRAGSVKHDGEFPNNFWNVSEVVMLNTDTKSYSVLPSGFQGTTQQLLIQVSLSDFTGASASDWNNAPGLVYELSVTANDAAFKALGDFKPSGLAIDFSKFAPDDSALPKDKYIQYFVRAVALTEGLKPGTAAASYSETVIINYGKSQAEDIKFLPQVKIVPEIPVVEKMTYTPVQWEATNWQYHYVVSRVPTMKEVFMGLVGSDEPYTPYQVGTKIDFTPQPENKSWWEEAWDAISDFFGSIADFAAKLVNWVSGAYADLKSGLINIVVSALPSDLQGPLRTALTAVVDYGLASMGIPPTLPNFDDLASMGTDYLASVAMAQAGIPADSIIEYGVGELSDKIGTALTASAKGASPNPMNWDFIKLDPDDLYRPAYIMLELYNPYDEPTPAGKLSFTADTFMDLKQNGFDQTITYLYAAYGSSYVCLYKPVFGMEIPPLAPGQRLTVPVILEEYAGIPFPGCSAPVSSDSFKLLYGGLGKYDFNLGITYELPPIGDEAKKQGHTEDAIYSYSTTGNYFSFTIDPGEAYGK